MSQSDLRQRQIREMLDYDVAQNRRVMSKQVEAVSQMDQSSLQPKKSDIEFEATVKSMVDGILIKLQQFNNFLSQTKTKPRQLEIEFEPSKTAPKPRVPAGVVEPGSKLDTLTRRLEDIEMDLEALESQIDEMMKVNPEALSEEDRVYLDTAITDANKQYENLTKEANEIIVEINKLQGKALFEEAEADKQAQGNEVGLEADAFRPPRVAEEEENTGNQYFDIEGTTPEDLRDQVDLIDAETKMDFVEKLIEERDVFWNQYTDSLDAEEPDYFARDSAVLRQQKINILLASDPTIASILGTTGYTVYQLYRRDIPLSLSGQGRKFNTRGLFGGVGGEEGENANENITKAVSQASDRDLQLRIEENIASLYSLFNGLVNKVNTEFRNNPGRYSKQSETNIYQLLQPIIPVAKQIVFSTTEKLGHDSTTYDKMFSLINGMIESIENAPPLVALDLKKVYDKYFSLGPQLLEIDVIPPGQFKTQAEARAYIEGLFGEYLSLEEKIQAEQRRLEDISKSKKLFKRGDVYNQGYDMTVKQIMNNITQLENRKKNMELQLENVTSRAEAQAVDVVPAKSKPKKKGKGKSGAGGVVDYTDCDDVQAEMIKRNKAFALNNELSLPELRPQRYLGLKYDNSLGNLGIPTVKYDEQEDDNPNQDVEEYLGNGRRMEYSGGENYSKPRLGRTRKTNVEATFHPVGQGKSLLGLLGRVEGKTANPVKLAPIRQGKGKQKVIKMSKKDYIDEHKDLIGLLKDTSKKLSKEAKQQSDELKKADFETARVAEKSIKKAIENKTGGRKKKEKKLPALVFDESKNDWYL